MSRISALNCGFESGSDIACPEFLFRMLIVNLPLDKEPAHKAWQDGAKLTIPRFCNSSFHDVIALTELVKKKHEKNFSSQ